MQELKLEQIATDRLRPYARNARTHSGRQIRKIAKSIQKFGFVNPVLMDDDFGIFAGHGRVEAAKLIGLTTVPAIKLSHLSEADRRAYVIADDKLALDAGWNRETRAALAFSLSLPPSRVSFQKFAQGLNGDSLFLSPLVHSRANARRLVSPTSRSSASLRGTCKRSLNPALFTPSAPLSHVRRMWNVPSCAVHLDEAPHGLAELQVIDAGHQGNLRSHGVERSVLLAGFGCFSGWASPRFPSTATQGILMQELKLEQIAIDRLRPYARNARTHSRRQIRKIARSIQKFGFVTPYL
jgi:hypothetical protein